MRPGRARELDDAWFDRARERMVEEHIVPRGIRDPRVVEAMRRVRRERFVSDSNARFAYDDRPLPIGSGQTISQPFIVAAMADAAGIGPDDRVLEIGTGSGYGAAVLGVLAAEVWSIERHHRLVESAREHLAAEGFDNVHVVEGDGTLGLLDEAPFDAIVVTAAAPEIPVALREQLVDGGRLVLPVESGGRGQRLVRVRRREDWFEEDYLGDVRFVPLIGEQGFGGPTAAS